MSEYIITIEDWFFKCVHERYTHFFGCPIEEITRCRDCKHWMDYEHEFEPNLGYCREFDREEVRDNDFCSFGERREQ